MDAEMKRRPYSCLPDWSWPINQVGSFGARHGGRCRMEWWLLAGDLRHGDRGGAPREVRAQSTVATASDMGEFLISFVNAANGW